MPTPEVGRLVYSKAGRDKNRYFIIVKIIDDDYVLIADGDLRKLEKPKKKKIKHIQLLSKIVEPVREKLEKGEKLTNKQLRRFMQAEMSEDGSLKNKEVE